MIFGALRTRVLAQRLAGGTACGVTVLTYHGVVGRITDDRLERNFHTVDAFRTQVQLLRRLRVITLGELGEHLRTESFPVRGATIAVTFDDGYANNTLAAAILAEAKIPWTLFVSTGAVDRDSTIWTAELALLLLHGRTSALELLGARWDLTPSTALDASFAKIRTALKALPAAERRQAMDALRGQYPSGESERLLAVHPAFRMLSWAAVRELASSDVEIGSHGVEHELHHADQLPATRQDELTRSRASIEAHVGRRCAYFSFPNGTTNEMSVAEAKGAGYELAFTTRAGNAFPNAEARALPRVEPGGKPWGLGGRLLDARAAPGTG